jgi:hypothetical protein
MLVELRGISPITEAGMVFTTDEVIWCGIRDLFEKSGVPLDGIFLLNEVVMGSPGVLLPKEATTVVEVIERVTATGAAQEVAAACGCDAERLSAEVRRFLKFARASGGFSVRF